MFHQAKKSLGQNFLKNEKIIQRIADEACLVDHEGVLEIGPGLGALTRELLLRSSHIFAVEKDYALFDHLTDSFSLEISQGKLILQQGDILTWHPEDLLRQTNTSSYKIVANIPYNITGAILEKFLSEKKQPTMMLLMVQKEVAERIIAKNKKTGGKGKESILSIAVKAYGEPSYVCTVKAGNFVPAPKVDSAVIKIDMISRKNFINDHHEQVFFQLVKTGFAHKRKTLLGNLKNIFEPEIVGPALASLSLSEQVRAEDLGITDWLSLSHIVYNEQYGTNNSSLL